MNDVVACACVPVVSLECVTRWKRHEVTYLLGHRADINASTTTAATLVCYVCMALHLDSVIIVGVAQCTLARARST